MSSRKQSLHRTKPGHPSKGGRGHFHSKEKPQAHGRSRGAKHVRHSHGIRKLVANVVKNPKGFGFLVFETAGVEDVFIPPPQAKSLFPGDRVQVTLSSQDEILDLKILAHRFREIVGRYTPHPAGPFRGGWVILERKRMREEVFVAPTRDPKQQPKEQDWVRLHLHFHTQGPYPVTGEVLEIYGPTLPPSADVGMIAAEFNLTEPHPQDAEEEAAQLPKLPADSDITSPGRTDLRHIPFITIDGETARDFDDAVFVERDKSGYALWVAIADVSHYVQPKSAIDADARERGTSVYFPERAFHMLPRALSENLCSLRPNEPRLALAVRMGFDRNGIRTETQLFEAVINSRRRATYTEIFSEWQAHTRDPKWEFAPHFALYQALRKSRLERGSIDFDLPEAETLVEPTGEVKSISLRPRNDAHRLIEEFMIAANEAVTEWIMEREWPFIYRVHDDPSPDSLEAFRKLAATAGVRFSAEQARTPKVMSEIIRRLEGHPAQALLNTAFLRSLKQAVYSSTHGTHYGLASEAYTHFTSPIRRYPDLIVHRMLRLALQTEAGKHKRLRGDARESLEQELDEAAQHCSYRERLAADAERESIRLKQTRMMLSHLGAEFPARVIGFSQAGIFAQIEEPYCEGLIPRDSMTDDFYEYDEDRMIFFGRRKRKTFKIGDPLRIRVVRADLERRQTEFSLLPTRQI